MGRAILDAPQFAHVPEKTVFTCLDEMFDNLGHKIPIADEPGAYAKGYSAAPCLRYFEQTFGTLCPVCLCPILHPKDMIERWQWLKPQPHQFINRWLVAGQEWAWQPCHNACKPKAAALAWLECGHEPDENRALMMIARPRFFTEHLNHCIEMSPPYLRFNPRKLPPRDDICYSPITKFGTDWHDGDIIFQVNHENRPS